MRRLDDMRHGEEGFSIAELLVAVVVGFLVLSAGYLLMETGLKSFRDIENTTTQSRAASTALETMSRDMREGTGITRAEPYDVEFLADADDNGAVERWRFYIEAGGTDLMRDMCLPSGGATTTATIARNVRNRVTGVPLFRYFSAPGASLSGTRTVKARVVHMSVIAQRQANPLPPAYRADVDVFLRNVPQE